MTTTTLNARETDVVSLDQFDLNDAADSSTLKFIGFYLSNPDDAMSKAFTIIITSKSTTLASDVAAFFTAYPSYSACSLDSYLMGMMYQAQHPDTVSKPADEKKYSLGTLVKLLGGKWPDGLPDPAIAKPSCSVAGGLLDISFELDFTTLSFENAIIAGNVRKLVTDASVQASLQCDYQPSLFIFKTKIIIVLDDIKLPLGNSQTLSVTKPTVSLSITPEFKSVAFIMSGDIPATIFDTPVDVDISLIINNNEASIGALITGDNASLPAPPGVKGLHFDQIGACMGLFFEPPGFAFGLQGKFHIGDSASGNIVDLDDDTFAVVCEYVEEAIVPKYVAFYVPKLDINKVIELFTNANPNIDIPVNFTELGFRWSTGINNSVALPDGTLSRSGWGFSADVDIFDFQFHGEANLDLNSGLSADLEMAPLSWGSVFKLSGDGKGYSVKVDGNGNPIRNNQVINTQALQDAVANATDKQITTPGGPVLIINTLSMPILHLNAQASLFELANFDIQADINKDGIKFELDYGVLLTTKVVCNLTDFHNLYAELGYFIDHSIPLPAINGQSLGSIPLKADIDGHFSITTSLTDIKLSTGGKFDFEGYHFSFDDFTADINISKISEFIGAVINHIVSEAKTIFSQITDKAEHWAEAAAKGVITGFDSAGKVLKNAYGALSQDVAAIMKAAGYTENEVADAIRNAWNCGLNDVAWAMQWVGYSATEVGKAVQHTFGTLAQDAANCLKNLSYTANQIGSMIKDAFGGDSTAVASVMKAAGYTENEVADAIRNAWNCGLNDVAWAMQWVGYSATEVGRAVQHTFGTLAQDAANCLKNLSYTANQIGSMIKDAFGGDSVGVAKVMKAAGYTENEVAGAIRNAWNCGVGDVVWAMQQVGYAAQEISGAIKNAFGDVAQDLANAFKAFGIGAQDAADTVKNVFGKAINDTASILKTAGYATSDVASALKNAFDTSVDAVGSAMKAVGYAADDVKNAFDDLGGDFKSFADTAWGDAKHYLNPSNW